MNNFTSSLFLPHTAVEKFPSVMKALKTARSRLSAEGGGRP
jgi:hypothetical protein